MNYLIPTHIKTSIEEEELMILNMDNGRFYGLDLIGAEIWRMIETNSSVDCIIAHLQMKYDLSKENTFSDVSNLINQLEKAGLVLKNA